MELIVVTTSPTCVAFKKMQFLPMYNSTALLKTTGYIRLLMAMQEVCGDMAGASNKWVPSQDTGAL